MKRTICSKCNETVLVSAYIRDKKIPLKIGLFCIKCKITSHHTNELFKKELESKEKKLSKKKPRNFVKYKEICNNPECLSTKISMRNIPESVHVYFDKGRNEWLVQRRNPQRNCKCLKCENNWATSREISRTPKYRIPPQIKREHLKLILMRVPENQLVIPKNKKKIIKLIFEEFEKEQ